MESDQKRAFLAVILSGIILFSWQYYMGPKTPAKGSQVSKTSTKVAGAAQTTNSNEVVKASDVKKEEPVKEIKRELLLLGNNKVKYEISNLLEVMNASNENQVYKFNEVVGSEKPFAVLFRNGNNYNAETFAFNKVSDTEAKFSNTNYSGSLLIDDKGKLNITFDKNVSVMFQMQSTPKELDGGYYREFAFLDDDLEKIRVGETENTDSRVQWLGIDFNYHLFAVALPTKLPSLVSVESTGLMNVKVNNVSSLNVVYTKKEYDFLKTLGDNLHLSVDFGIWSLLAEPLLWLLLKLYNLIPNYGIAIIFLTLVIRLVLFPLQYKSFKSMKKMQEIQPELTKLREKFKDDPQRMQKESMELFKRAGANPLGGCLPMLLQMPVFFALYKVLYSAVELVDAPFYFWITDLSTKDPFYILPVLMAASMFVQQKLTPTTVADPTQKKIMMFMPLIFGLIMKDLPAGLSLYILVSTVFGVAQQIFVYKRT